MALAHPEVQPALTCRYRLARLYATAARRRSDGRQDPAAGLRFLQGVRYSRRGTLCIATLQAL